MRAFEAAADIATLVTGVRAEYDKHLGRMTLQHPALKGNSASVVTLPESSYAVILEALEEIRLRSIALCANWATGAAVDV